MKLRLAALAVVSMLAAAAPAHAVNLLLNGDFETGTLTFWHPLGAVANVTESAYAACCGFATTHPDNNVAAFGGGGGPDEQIYQAFNSVLGQRYTLSFDLGAVGAGNTNFVHVSSGYAFHDYALQGTPDFDAAVSTYTLSFLGLGGSQVVAFNVGSYVNDDVDVVLDNITLTANVPEPATWALMIGGFGLAGAALRRRRAIAA